MALKKTHQARGHTGSYIRLRSLRWDADARSAGAIFGLYRDQEHSEACKIGTSSPMKEIFAKVRLEGDEFDAAFGASADGAQIVKKFYQAAKKGQGVSSDWGNSEAMKDAEDVIEPKKVAKKGK